MRIVILVAVVVAAALIGFTGIRDALQNSDASSALADYLDDVKRGDYASAYHQLCRDALDGYAEAEHARFLKEQPGFTSFELDNATTSTSAGGTEITFSVHFLDAAGGTRVVRMHVDMQEEGPKVCDGPGSRITQ
jgi:hypothetical protein